jgi:hypothetical protein
VPFDGAIRAFNENLRIIGVPGSNRQASLDFNVNQGLAGLVEGLRIELLRLHQRLDNIEAALRVRP